MNDDQRKKFDDAEAIIGHHFKNEQLLLSAITHPSANEGRSVRYSYERLEFLGDSVLGAIVATAAFNRFHDLDEGGLTRIKVALVSGASLAEVAEGLGLAEVIMFGSSEQGTGKRGLHSALENVYEAIVAALFLDAGMDAARKFVENTLIDRMSLELAQEPENPKSALQEKLQEDGITPTYKLVETQGPPHDRTFVAQVFAGDQGLAQGTGRTKKEAESQAAKSTLARLGEFFGLGLTEDEKVERIAAQQQARVDKVTASAQAKLDKAHARAAENRERERKKSEKKQQQQKRAASPEEN
ncbi:MAG: ribonuclease III [Eggerthellaceae bacterium]|nr:ribonuclease III [Eggerthellaceae bacterium]